MALASALATVLKPQVVTTFAEDGHVELREKKADMRVTVVGLPASGAAVRVENVGHLSKLRDPCRRVCDYLLVLETNGDTSVLFIELKKTQTPSDRPREQLRRSLPILKYLLSVCEVERGTTVKSVSVRYAIVFERVSEKLDKQRIRADPKTRLSQEKYRGITVRTFTGTRVSLATLMGA